MRSDPVIIGTRRLVMRRLCGPLLSPTREHGAQRDEDGESLPYRRSAQGPVGQYPRGRHHVTLSIAAGAAVLWLVGGVSVGVLSALKRGTLEGYSLHPGSSS